MQDETPNANQSNEEVPQIELLLAKIDQTEQRLSEKIYRLSKQIREVNDTVIAPRALGIGDGLILAKLAFDNAILTVEESDRLIGPHLIMNGIYEKGLTTYFRTIIDQVSVYVDIGANVGYYTVLFGRQLRNRGSVFAFEPDQRNFELLNRNMQINWIDKPNIVTERLAVGGENGSAELFRHNTKPGNSSIVPLKAVNENDITASTVEVVRLDDYLKDKQVAVDLMKIDVEGYEFAALKGSLETIARSRSIRLVVEWDPQRWAGVGVKTEDVLALLEPLNMKAAVVSSRGVVEQVDSKVLAEVTYNNVIFCHQENSFT